MHGFAPVSLIFRHNYQNNTKKNHKVGSFRATDLHPDAHQTCHLLSFIIFNINIITIHKGIWLAEEKYKIQTAVLNVSTDVPARSPAFH